MKQIPSSVWLFGLAILVVGGLIGFAVWNGAKPAVADAFAQCLAEKQVTMYGAWWCPHCNNEKKLFGSSFEFVNYVECSPNGSKEMSQECKDAGVKGYPTWIFADGTRAEGEQSFEQLSTKTGCPVPPSE